MNGARGASVVLRLVGRFAFGAVLFASLLLMTSPAAASVPGAFQEEDKKAKQEETQQEPAEATAAPDAAEAEGAEEKTDEAAQQTSIPGKFSGLMFGDYYNVTNHRREDVADQSGFWFRRIYFTYEYKINDSWDTRFRLEGNSPGRFTIADTIDPFVKDAYIRWRNDSTAVYLGISSPPTWNYIEGFWGYRWLEKTPLDLQRFASSRDFGVAVRGTLGSSGRLHYHAMFGNGSGSKSEVGRGKAVYGSLRYELTDQITVEAYADFRDRDRGAKHTTYQAFAGFESGSTRIGLQYARQEVTLNDPEREDFDMNLLSAFLVQGLSERLTLVLRADRMFDPNPVGEIIAYLPFASDAKSLFMLAGIDYDFGHGIHLMPNIEWITYEAVDGGPDPDDDVMLRGTFYWSWG